MARIYISSTYPDLAEVREAVFRTMRMIGHDVIAMQDYVATEQRPLEKCLADVRSCDIYVGIIAWRYGYIPKGQERSITELEFREAVKEKIPILVFLLDDDAPILPKWLDRDPRKISAFRKELTRDYIVRFFTTPVDISVEVVSAIDEVLYKRKSKLQKIDEFRLLNEAKLIFVGNGSVGKTSLVKRLVNDIFDDQERKTPGIKITNWLVPINGGDDIRLNIWDFGGQEIMHSTHQFFLTQRSLYVLVLNGRQGHEDSDAEYWLNLIKSFAENSPVIVVLNKIKEQPFDLNRSGLAQKFPVIRGFVETDCSDRTGIEELFKTIQLATQGLEHIKVKFPKNWFAIKERLAAAKENYLNFDKFRRICAENGERDPQAQESLASYLHILGIALNFMDDPRLRDTHVLNPHWVTNGIYSIINSKVLAAQKGELRLNDLTNILDSANYPLERHAFLIELMQKFELCFRFPEDEPRYLIPDLLSKEQAPEVKDFNANKCLNFQFHYPILPEGLLPRFIVRTHALSNNTPRWRMGVILEFEGNRALIMADIQDKRVLIYVAGPSAGRRRLLAVIRSDFEFIHRNFKFHPNEMVPVPGHPDVLVSYRELIVMEDNGLKELPKVAGGELLTLSVEGLLNGVDLENARQPVGADGGVQPLRLFYSYSHKDEVLRSELETHVKLLHRQGLIISWHDRQITAGDEWKGEIDENLELADIVILLVSADFIASDYCYDIEMARTLDRHECNKARVIPVIIRDVNWHSAPFAKLQVLPTDGKAVTLWTNRDSAWRNVSEGIEEAIKMQQVSKAARIRRK